MWWYKSKKYSSEQILIDTQRLYVSAMFRFTNMNTKSKYSLSLSLSVTVRVTFIDNINSAMPYRS